MPARRDLSAHSRPRRAAAATLAVGFASALLLGGCGESAYKAGLNRTSEYYAHLETIEKNLKPPYVSPLGLVQVRVPQQFVPTPIPTQEEVDLAVAQGQPNPLDAIHPSYLGVRLPGLIGTWSVMVDTNVDGVDEPRAMYLYVATNEAFLGQEQAADADGSEGNAFDFLARVEAELAGALDVDIPAGVMGDDGGPVAATGGALPTNIRYTERYPGSRYLRFHDAKTLTEIEFRPLGEVQAFDVPYRIHLYEHEPAGSDVRVAVLLVVPEGISPAERLDDRLELMFATLKVTGSNARPGGGPAM